MIAFDTNLLVYLHRAALPEHASALRALQRARDDERGWGVPLPCVAEFWSVVTHPACAGGPSTGLQAQDFLKSLVSRADGRVWLPTDGCWERLTRLATDLQVGGKRIFDLQIALIAFDNGASEIWTHDRGFTAMPGLLVHDPL